MTCQERRDLMLLYVTGALEPAETAALREHLLKGCPTCAGALAEAEATVHQIPQSLPPAPAPAGTWEKIEQRITTKDRIETAAPSTSQPKPIFPWAVAAAGLIAVAILSFQIVQTNRQLAATQTTLATAQKELSLAQSSLRLASITLDAAQKQAEANQVELTNLKGQVKKLNDAKDHLQLAMFTMMDSDRFRMNPMAQKETHATIFASKSEKKWMLCANKLPPLPAGKTYELWIIPEGKSPIPAGTFEPDSSGMTMHETKLPDDVGLLATAAVTIEPEGGAQTPTMPIQFAIDVRQN